MNQLLIAFVFVSFSYVHSQTTCGHFTVEQAKPKNGMWLVYVETDQPWTEMSINCTNGEHKANVDFKCPTTGYYTQVTDGKGHPAACKYRIPSVCKTKDYGYGEEPDKLIGRLALTKQTELVDANIWKVSVNKMAAIGTKVEIHCKAHRATSETTEVYQTAIHYMSCIRDPKSNGALWHYDNAAAMSSLGFRAPRMQIPAATSRPKRSIGENSISPPTFVCKLTY